jgi:hypothetical protein
MRIFPSIKLYLLNSILINLDLEYYFGLTPLEHRWRIKALIFARILNPSHCLIRHLQFFLSLSCHSQPTDSFVKIGYFFGGTWGSGCCGLDFGFEGTKFKFLLFLYFFEVSIGFRWDVIQSLDDIL